MIEASMPFRFSRDGDILVIVADGIIRPEDVPVLDEGEQRFFAENPKVVLFLCDCTEMKIIAPDARDRLAALMRKDNPRIQKSAYVLSEATASLQIRRMIRDVGTDKRQIFKTREDARAWLHEK
jgi:hypothetical protein